MTRPPPSSPLFPYPPLSRSARRPRRAPRRWRRAPTGARRGCRRPRARRRPPPSARYPRGRGSHALDALLAEETARLEHEEHHDDGERDDVPELGAAGDEGRRRRLEDAEEQAADDRAVDVAEPADRRGGEADDAAGDAHDEVDLAVVEPAE